MIRPIPRLTLPADETVERRHAAFALTAAQARVAAVADGGRQPPWLADRARTLANAIEAFLADLERCEAPGSSVAAVSPRRP